MGGRFEVTVDQKLWIRSIMRRSQSTESLLASNGLKGMRVWNARYSDRTTLCISYDKIHNLWQASKQTDQGQTEYLGGDDGLPSFEACIEALANSLEGAK
jgi:hypothetical protein